MRGETGIVVQGEELLVGLGQAVHPLGDVVKRRIIGGQAARGPHLGAERHQPGAGHLDIGHGAAELDQGPAPDRRCKGGKEGQLPIQEHRLGPHVLSGGVDRGWLDPAHPAASPPGGTMVVGHRRCGGAHPGQAPMQLGRRAGIDQPDQGRIRGESGVDAVVAVEAVPGDQDDEAPQGQDRADAGQDGDEDPLHSGEDTGRTPLPDRHPAMPARSRSAARRGGRQDAQLHGPRHRRSPPIDAELGEDVDEVGLDRRLADVDCDVRRVGLGRRR